jgi:xanthine dehydrogenase iron-sulfur cluster and FAD-binding subunit A
MSDGTGQGLAAGDCGERARMVEQFEKDRDARYEPEGSGRPAQGHA